MISVTPGGWLAPSRPRRAVRRRRGFVVRAIHLAVGASVALAPVVDSLRPGIAPAPIPVRARQTAVRLSDMGYPMPERPSARNRPSCRPLVAGECWTPWRTCGEKWDDRELAARILRIVNAVLREHERDETLRAFLIRSWFHPQELARFCWLVSHGYAGRGTLEFIAEENLRTAMPTRAGYVRTAEHHFRVIAGLQAGLTFTAGGWYDATADVGAQFTYCSNSGGDDGDDGLTVGTAKQTLAAASGTLRNLNPDWLLLKAGDTWPDEKANFRFKGADPAHPELAMVIAPYGTGARPVIDVQSQAAGIECVDSAGLFIDGVRTTSSTLVGDGPQPTGISMLDQCNDCIVQDVEADHLTGGIAITRSGTHPARFTLHRCLMHENFDVNNQQSGVGFFAGEIDDFLIEQECVYDHNGWLEDRPILTVTIDSAADATHITLGSGSSSDGTYVGCKVDPSGPTNGPFTVTAYVGATKTMTVTPAMDNFDIGGNEITVLTAPKNVFRHNTYIQKDCLGVIRRRSVSTRSANHGFGRGEGNVHSNLADGCQTGFQIAGDTNLTGGTDTTHDNVAINFTLDLLNRAGDACAGFSNDTNSNDASENTDNICANYLTPDENFPAFGYVLKLPVPTLFARNRAWKIGKNAEDFKFDAVMLQPITADAAHVVRGNVIDQPGVKRIMQLQVIGGVTPSWTFEDNVYRRDSSANAFLDDSNGEVSYATWAGTHGESGSTFSTGAALFTDPDRDLAQYEHDVEGGTDSLAAAVARLLGMGRDNWENDFAINRINFVRSGFGMSSLSLEYPEGGGGAPVPALLMMFAGGEG